MILIAGAKRQNDDGINIVQRYGRNNHQRCHTGIAIDILDKGNAENGGAAPGGGLGESAHHRLVLHKDACQCPDAHKHDGGANHTENDKFRVESISDRCGGNVFEQQDGQ